MTEDNRYKDMKCVIHFGDNRKQIMREFQDSRIKLAEKYIRKQEVTALRQIDLLEELKAA
ncbi:MAG: hypothetical protein IJ121_01500 [Eubacterium sp.]|nr:hypothetical protein [Eubacterium sp.]